MRQSALPVNPVERRQETEASRMMEIDHAVLRAIGELEPSAYLFPVHAEIVQSVEPRPSLGALHISIRFLEERGLIAVTTGNLMRLTAEGKMAIV